MAISTRHATSIVQAALPAGGPDVPSARMAAHRSLLDELGGQFLRHLRTTGSVVIAANLTGATRRAYYARRERDPAFAEAWDDALATYEEEVTSRVVSTALAMGTARLVPVLNEDGSPALDDDFEPLWELDVSRVNPAVLNKLQDKRVRSVDGPAQTNVQVNTTVNAAPRPTPRLVMPAVTDDDDDFTVDAEAVRADPFGHPVAVFQEEDE